MNVNLWETFFGVSANPLQRYINETRRLLPIQNQVWGVKQPVWVDTGEAWRLFIEIPELRAVISKRAEMMSANEPRLYDKKGERVTKHWLLDMINNPNPTQSWADVVYTLGVQDGIYSNTFIYAPLRSFNVRNLFIPLPSNKITINLSGKKLKQMDADGLITDYVFTDDAETKETLPFEDVVYLTTSDGMNIVKPISRIESLKFPLSNIRATYNKRNVLLENIGAIGILSAQQNDMGGAIPMDPEEKKRIQKSWYQQSKDEIIITEANVQWQPMSFPTKDLMLFEEMTADKMAILDAYGMSVNLFSTEKGATFSNVKDSYKMTIQDTVKPLTQKMYDAILEKFGLQNEYYLEACFDHLPMLQIDEQLEAQRRKLDAETLRTLSDLGVGLDAEEIKKFLGLNNYY
jgi:HK97 family phage portal protein